MKKGFWYLLMVGSLGGWIFVIKGLVTPFQNKDLKRIWLVAFCTWVLGHPLELILSIGIGRAAGLSALRTIVKTLAFGFTWWLPLKMGVMKN